MKLRMNELVTSAEARRDEGMRNAAKVPSAMRSGFQCGMEKAEVNEDDDEAPRFCCCCCCEPRYKDDEADDEIALKID